MFNKQVYFVEYEFLGKVSYCQIEASSIDQCERVFFKNFDTTCLIRSVKTSKELAECFASSMIEKIKQDLKF